MFSLRAVVPGYCAVGCCLCHWLLLLLPRGQELQDHGLIQESGPTGEFFLASAYVKSMRV